MEKRKAQFGRVIAGGALAWVAVLSLIMLDGSAQSPPIGAGATAQVDFNWHIRPILAETAFSVMVRTTRAVRPICAWTWLRARTPNVEHRRARGARLCPEILTTAS